MATTFSSREFNQDTGRAKKAAENGPVFITDRGRPAHVLLSIEEYRRLTDLKQAEPAKEKTIAELLSMPADDDIDFDPPRLGGDWGFKIPDFS